MAVHGNSSRFQNSGELIVGEAGSGELEIRQSGEVSTLNGWVGGLVGSSGIVTVNGSGSELNVGESFAVGGTFSASGGPGVLNVETGGKVAIDGTLYVWCDGHVNINGGTLTAGSYEYFNCNQSPASILMTGTGKFGADSFQGGLIQEGLTMIIGDSPGLSEVLGDYEMRSGAIEFELAGLVRGLEFDALDVTGFADVNGVMDVNLIDGFRPTLGDSFDLMNFASFSGASRFDFSDASLSGTGLRWDTSLFSFNGSIFVSAVPEPSSIVFLAAFAGLAIAANRRKKKEQWLAWGLHQWQD
jgi:T5SS/PEP-CTERM-associated repeat protein